MERWMEIYALTGKSGTGKSFQATALVNKYGIEGIIDDGLFILGGSIVAGVSAKRQETKIGAVKTALFMSDVTSEAVARKIVEIAPKSLLVIGTSDKMVRRILNKLSLPDPIQWIRIEEVTSIQERETAQKQRHEHGQHIIPAPTFEVKKDFSGYFIHPIRILKEIKIGRPQDSERSVVRPTYSYLGKYTISDKAIGDIVMLVASDVAQIDSVPSLYIVNRKKGVSIELGLIMVYSDNILEPARQFQKEIAKRVEAMTALNILSVDIEIHGLMWNKTVA
jgi:uncharacterized alkaline shock family protein YloU/adenylate kinase family enzyme